MTMKEARELVDELAEKYDTNKDGKFSYPGNERVVICTCIILPKVKKENNVKEVFLCSRICTNVDVRCTSSEQKFHGALIFCMSNFLLKTEENFH